LQAAPQTNCILRTWCSIVFLINHIITCMVTWNNVKYDCILFLQFLFLCVSFMWLALSFCKNKPLITRLSPILMTGDVSGAMPEVYMRSRVADVCQRWVFTETQEMTIYIFHYVSLAWGEIWMEGIVIFCDTAKDKYYSTTGGRSLHPVCLIRKVFN